MDFPPDIDPEQYEPVGVHFLRYKQWDRIENEISQLSVLTDSEDQAQQTNPPSTPSSGSTSTESQEDEDSGMFGHGLVLSSPCVQTDPAGGTTPTGSATPTAVATLTTGGTNPAAGVPRTTDGATPTGATTPSAGPIPLLQVTNSVHHSTPPMRPRWSQPHGTPDTARPAAIWACKLGGMSHVSILNRGANVKVKRRTR